MNNQPLVSVLIASYNNGKYLEEAIQSVCRQTYTHWELIIVDDGSTDESASVYASHSQDSRIKIFYNGSNKGCAYTKRRCIELCGGAYFGFLDSDDALVDIALETMVKAHEEQSHVGLVYSRYYRCNESLNLVGVSGSQRVIPQGSSLLQEPYAVSHFVTIKKVFYNLTEGIDETLPCAEDQDLYYKMEEVAPLFFINIPLYLYRMTGQNISCADRIPQALCWHAVAIYKACRRRGIADAGQYMLAVLQRAVTVQAAIEHHKSLNYKVGNALLRPLRWLRLVKSE